MLAEVFNVPFNFPGNSRKLKCFFPFGGMHPNSYRTASSMNTFNNQLSLYIPRVTPEWADLDRMAAKFLELEVGKVRRIDFVEKTSANGYQYYQAFVHFETWNDCQTTRHMQERIADPNRQCRLVYNDPWYWLLLKNNNPLSDTEYRLEQRIIDLEQRLDQNDELIASLQQHADSSDYWLGAALRHIEQLDETQHHLSLGTAPAEDYVTSLEGLSEHTRMTLEELNASQPNAEEQAWLDEQLLQQFDQEDGECGCCCSESDSMPSLIDDDEEWVPEDSEDEDSDEESDEDYAEMSGGDDDDQYDRLEAAIESGHVITRQASDGGPDRKRARMGPLYQVGEICHDENGTAYVWTGHSWADHGPVPMDIDSEDELEQTTDDVDALAAQFERLNLDEDDNNTKMRLAFTHQMCDNC